MASVVRSDGSQECVRHVNLGKFQQPVRGMRWHLLQTFDKIYVLDLHGNAKKKEVTPEGGADKNVFDIQQGVAIIIAVKKCGKSKQLAEVYHGELWGGREAKYQALSAGSISQLIPQRLACAAPQFAFVPRDHSLAVQYGKGFGVQEFMPVNSVGIVTARDVVVIDFSKEGLTERISRFADSAKTDEQVRAEFFPVSKVGKYDAGDSGEWKLPAARKTLQATNWQADIQPIAYRPFDTRFILYRPDMVDRGRVGFMRHLLAGANISLLTTKAHRDDAFAHASVCEKITEVIGLSPRTASNSVNFPLYIYPDEQDLDQTRRINFDEKLYQRLKKLATHSTHGTPDEVAVFDYLYGVLHCPAYRATYAEFLKTDFPRIPYPASPDEFWSVSEKGTALRKLHLMEPAAIGATPFTFMGEGDSVVNKPRFADGKVWINATQYFDNAPEIAWGFFIGGYQPAQKWLKDRKGRALSFEDVKHYQRILKILSETNRIMGEITMTLAE